MYIARKKKNAKSYSFFILHLRAVETIAYEFGISQIAKIGYQYSLFSNIPFKVLMEHVSILREP